MLSILWQGGILKTFVLFALAATASVAQAQSDTAWVRTWRGPGGDARTRLVAVTPSGDLYAAGYTMGAADSGDYLVLKYSSTGDLLWLETYNGPAGGVDMVTDLAVDSDGNCYVTGHSEGANGADYATIKYLSSGSTAWLRRYDGPVENDKADAVAVDNAGNVYVTGYSVGQGTASDLVTIKYDAGGNQQWLHRYDGAGFIDWGHDIAVGDSGRVFVTGQSATFFFAYDWMTICYTSGGDTAWTRRYAGSAGGWDEAHRLELDPAGNLLVFGYVSTTDSLTDFALVKYDVAGDTAWVRGYDGPAGLSDWPQDMAVDDNGDVFVCGGSGGDDTLYDYATIGYGNDGSQRWVSRYERTQTDIAWGIAAGDSGCLYVTGSSDIEPWLADVVTLKLNTTSGSVLRTSLYDGPTGGSDACLDIAVGPDNLPVAVGSTGDSTGTSALVIKYTRSPGIAGSAENPLFRPRFPTVMRLPRLLAIDGRVLDALGRDVTDRKAQLAPGFYFLVTAAHGRPRRVVIAR